MSDYGSQNRVFYYKQDLKSSEFNRIFSKTIPTGIYEGGEVTVLGTDGISIAPMTLVIADARGQDIAVRIRTTEDIVADVTGGSGQLTLLQDSTRPLLVARLTWSAIQAVFVDFLQVAETLNDSFPESLNTYDVVLGKIEYDGIDVIGFDESRKQWALSKEDFFYPYFKVSTAQGTGNEKKLYVESGAINTRNGLVNVAGTITEALTDTVNGRIDYVYLDESGSIQIEEGVDEVFPEVKPFYGRKVLALITRGAGRTTVRGDDITHLEDYDRAEIMSSTILLNRLSEEEVFDTETITVDDALRELFAKSATIEGRAIDLENGVVYKNNEQIISGLKNFSIMPRMINDTTVLTPSLDSHPITKKFYDDVTASTGTGAVKINGNQTVYDVKTFNSLPKVPTTDPTEDEEVISKKVYDDTTETSGKGAVKINGNQTVYDVKTFNSFPKVPTTTPTESSQVISKNVYDNGNSDGQGAVKVGSSGTPSDQTVYGYKKLYDTDGTEFARDAVKDKIIIKGGANGTEGYKITVYPNGTLDGDYTVTLPTDGSVVVKKGEQVSCSDVAQSIAGQKTFTTIPKVPTTPAPSDSAHVIGKKYYDDDTENTGLGAVKINGDQTVYAVKTFNSSPKVPTTPADDNSAINKRYLNSSDSGVVHTTGNETINGEKTFGSEVTAPSFNATSLRKYKENITPFKDSALDIINTTEIVNFSYKEDREHYKHTGFIADDTHELLTGSRNNTMAIPDVLGVALKAIQELSEENKELRKLIEEIRSK